MRKGIWLGILCGLLCLGNPKAAFATTGEVTDYVADFAELLSPEEEVEIQTKAEQLHEKWNQDFVVVTTYDAEGKTAEAYADDYYDQNGYGENGVLYLVDLDNGTVWISTCGAAIRFLTDERIESVIDAGYYDIKSSAYKNGFLNMMDQTDQYMTDGIPNHQYTYDVETGKISRHRTVTWVEALIAMGLAVVTGGGYALSVHSSYKMKTSDYKYPFMERGQVAFTRKEDRFINQVVTRRKIPKNPPSSGGSSGRSSTHTSSSGRSHGGGGRSL